MASVMVTGGAGYIGSHAVLRLVRDGHDVVVLDNLVRGHRQAIDAIERATGKHVELVVDDAGNLPVVTDVLRRRRVSAILHFAALAYVGESVERPLDYYRANTAAAIGLLEACNVAGVDRLVFSSTCATYGEPATVPIPETCPQSPISPYGRSKLMVEHMLADFAESRARAGRPFAYAALRYFNVAGCDRSGIVGEAHDPETHLIPIVLQAALGLRDRVNIFGTDYPTPDGTCIRDYIHVEDLIDAHVRTLDSLKPGDRRAYNLGIGRGHSVREIIAAAERVTGRKIPIVEGPRRPGDPPQLFADPARIRRELGWSASITNLDDTIASAWNWMRSHPKGYT